MDSGLPSEYERGRRAGIQAQEARENAEWRQNMERRLGAVETELRTMKSAFDRFVAATEAVAASAVTNRTFWLGVAVVVVAILGVVLGHK